MKKQNTILVHVLAIVFTSYICGSVYAEGVERTRTSERTKEVVRADRGPKIERSEKNEKVERVLKAERPEKTVRPEKVEKVEHVEKAERPEKVEKLERVEKVERPEKVEKGEQNQEDYGFMLSEATPRSNDGYLLYAPDNPYKLMQLTSFTPASVTTAVPEADTSAMLLIGLGVIGFVVHRRKNTQS
ncbi:PEP-CTERM protein-sorting domain containing protein [Methylophilaceae bacterium]